MSDGTARRLEKPAAPLQLLPAEDETLQSFCAHLDRLLQAAIPAYQPYLMRSRPQFQRRRRLSFQLSVDVECGSARNCVELNNRYVLR